MTAAGLAAAFATMPLEWRDALAWDAAASRRVIEAVGRISGDRPIAPDDPFRALRLVPPGAARVVVFGQDPYPGAGHADGLAFSAPTSSRPSLRRIFDVLESDRPGWRRPASGRLDPWALQGVLLLNPVLTVEIGRPNSHVHADWQALTAGIVRHLSSLPDPPIYLLWGSQAASFFSSTLAGVACRPRALATRHPSNDYHRRFMAEGSHFLATADRVDWWRLGAT